MHKRDDDDDEDGSHFNVLSSNVECIRYKNLFCPGLRGGYLKSAVPCHDLVTLIFLLTFEISHFLGSEKVTRKKIFSRSSCLRWLAWQPINLSIFSQKKNADLINDAVSFI